ncbi:biotin/lipoyl attachment [Desulforamulus reducens MI-1]|uniref:Biotin/lipoyl attachment n=1 Tax=Desulforamulus reducens (strain ATCC BAA-1160 / DSM 100696 / MI-1) TaxID=349161 RepID=A4J1A9_DESRM|nr:selenium-dependent molybdenum cofactor biosynthesis protein YqeB [Desulforamulus reducens]ABO48862.1 biotin/lipoyl attachment [Desulforamulus reducens MI-1]
MNRLIVIKGAGDLATGIAHRLHCSGFSVVTTELPQPTVIRRTVSFAEAIYTGTVVVEGITAVKTSMERTLQVVEEGKIPVVVDPTGVMIKQLQPWAVVDAILAKRNVGTQITDAPIVVGVGPGFTAGVDVHAVVESMRGHYLGRVIHAGQAIPNTGIPGELGGYAKERILRAPCAGVFRAERQISDLVSAGETVAWVNEQPVVVAISGVLRGLLKEGLSVEPDMKIGDVDPRCQPEHCFTISDKARSIGGGVLEALLYYAARAHQG